MEFVGNDTHDDKLTEEDREDIPEILKRDFIAGPDVPPDQLPPGDADFDPEEEDPE